LTKDIDSDGGILVKDSYGEMIRAYPLICERCWEKKPLYSVDQGLAILCMNCIKGND
jgi:hypothetical protein